MIVTVYNAQQQPIKVGPEVGAGGEATIYAVLGQPMLLAKIFTKPPTPTLYQKLAWMQANPPRGLPQTYGHTSIAWPLDLLYFLPDQLIHMLEQILVDKTLILRY